MTDKTETFKKLLNEANMSTYLHRFHLSRDEVIELVEAWRAQQMPGEAKHSDDLAVDRFAAAMKAKLAKARAKGREGWDDPDRCSVEFLADLLLEHLDKGNEGNFEDIANLCMMLHQRGASPSLLALCSPPAPAAVLDVPSDEMLSEGMESLRRGLKRFGDNYAQIVTNIWEDMHHAAPAPAEPDVDEQQAALFRQHNGAED